MEWSFDGIVDVLSYARLPLVALLAVVGIARWTPTRYAGAIIPAALALVSLFLSGHRRPARYDWHAQTALVTGSSGGLGRSIVAELRRKKCKKIVCIDLHPCNDDHRHPTIVFEPCDLGADRVTVEATLRDVQRNHGPVSLLISNAGIMVGKPLLELDQEQFERTISVNLLATHRCLRVFLPDMIERRTGHVAAVGSIMSYVGVSELCDYVASKHALAGLMQSLRYELDNVYRLATVSTTLLVLGQLRTPLFERVAVHPIVRFFMPLQHPSVVARDLVRAIERERSARIYRPYLARFAPVLPSLPDWARDTVQAISGANTVFRKTL